MRRPLLFVFFGAFFGAPARALLAARLPRARVQALRMQATTTERLMATLPDEAQTGGAGGQSTYDALLRLDEAWAKLRAGEMLWLPAGWFHHIENKDPTVMLNYWLKGGPSLSRYFKSRGSVEI